MTVLDIIKELERTTSRNEKIKILQENKDNNMLKEVLLYTYNPYYNYYIRKVPIIKNHGIYTFGQSWGRFKKLLDDLRYRKITGDNAIENVKEFLSTVNKETYELYKQIFKKKLTKAGINIKTINKVFRGLILEFKIQLANRYDPSKISRYPDYWYVSPKLDGIRAIYLYEDGGLYTRQGHKIIGFEHIEERCSKICKEYELSFLDGELYSDEVDFNTIQSCVMKQKNFSRDIKEKIYYYIFALGECRNTKEMVDILNLIDMASNNHTIAVVPQLYVRNDINELIYRYLKVAEQYEGLMLRHPTNYYDWKRSDALVKFKHFNILEIYENYKDKIESKLLGKIKEYLDRTSLVLDDFVIIAYTEGQGNFKGMLGSLTIKGRYKGKLIQSNVGSGFEIEQRRELWKIRDELIGKEVVVKCQEITKDNSLRFPVIEHIKLDR